MQKRTAKKSPRQSAETYDLIIIGGGPAGLALAASLHDLQLRIALIEKSSEKILAAPPPDGREIALTHTSIAIMEKLGMMRHIAAQDRSPICQAKVLNGTSPYTLTFDSEEAGKEALGYLVPNYVIRKATYVIVKGQKNLDLITGVDVADVSTNELHSRVTLSDGRVLQAALTVAADGRFSGSRRMMGVPVRMRDFGRTVIVCRIEHTKPHFQTAYECFHYERTLAVLPLNGGKNSRTHLSSAVITLSSKEAPKLLAMSDEEFNADLSARFGDHLGAIKLAGEKHSYPLVATYADRFHAPRFALIGDAAVGMHPVTAHGYNFGLYGQDILASAIRDYISLGLDIGAPELLEKFSREHRLATLPIYLGTNFLVGLFTDERPAMKLARNAVLRAGNWLLPFKKLVTHHLTATSFAA